VRQETVVPHAHSPLTRRPEHAALSEAIRLAVAPPTVRRAVAIAGVVAPILILINQYDALFGPAELNWLKMALTAIVPYCVSTYSAVSASWAPPAPVQQVPRPE
jgi:hypothetical protein